MSIKCVTDSTSPTSNPSSQKPTKSPSSIANRLEGRVTKKVPESGSLRNLRSNPPSPITPPPALFVNTSLPDPLITVLFSGGSQEPPSSPNSSDPESNPPSSDSPPRSSPSFFPFNKEEEKTIKAGKKIFPTQAT